MHLVINKNIFILYISYERSLEIYLMILVEYILYTSFKRLNRRKRPIKKGEN